jgi:hypothetical protein
MKYKKIEIIINEMIDKTLELGHTPSHIYLTQEQYSKLVEEMELFEPAGIKIIENGLVYKPDKQYKHLDKYKGLDVVVGSETRMVWK